MSTLGTFARFVPMKGNPIEKVLGLGKKAIKKTKNKGGALVSSSGSALATTGSKAVKGNPTSSSALSYALPDATKARAKGRRGTQTAIEGTAEKKKSNMLPLALLGGGVAVGTGAGIATRAALSKKKKAEMSGNTNTASFAESDPFKPRTSFQKKNASSGVRDKEKQRFAEAFGNADEAGKKAMEKQSGKYLRQRNIENLTDAKGGIGKAYGKAGLKDVANVSTAVAGMGERKLINAGKNSKSKIVQDLAKGAEAIGRKGYTAGATGARGVLNKIAGRTLTGKAVRLGAAGAGIAAIGGAMKKKREDQY